MLRLKFLRLALAMATLGLVLTPSAFAGEGATVAKPDPKTLDSTHLQPKVKAPQAEVEHLLQYLQKSGCRFNRNGTWYPSDKAVDHLRRKYAYLVKKGLFTTTESFIEKAATESSMSGKAYEVQCGSEPATASAQWLGAELARYRLTSP